MYRLDTDDQAQQQVEALPATALGSYAELRAALEVGPWTGEPVNDLNPDGPLRTLTFGADHQGMVTYPILDRQRRVDILSVLWLG